MHRRTVRRYLATPEVPRNRPPERPTTARLDLADAAAVRRLSQGRWQAGCTNVAQLKRELDAQGYRGSYSLHHASALALARPRPPPDPTSRRRRGRPRIKRVNVRWLCLRPPDQLEPHECDALQDILNEDERLATGYELLQRFRRLIESPERARPRSNGWRMPQIVGSGRLSVWRMAFRRIMPRSSTD